MMAQITHNSDDGQLKLYKAQAAYIAELEGQVKEIDSELTEAQARIRKQFIQMHEQQNELNMLRPIAGKGQRLLHSGNATTID